jgi:hypothetical protein
VEHSVVITFDGSSAAIFIDGVLDNRKHGDFSIPGYFGSIAAIGTWLVSGASTPLFRPETISGMPACN